MSFPALPIPASTFRDPLSWPLLPLPVNGQLTWPTLAQSVRNSIRILLLTRPGEQLMRPRLGAGIANFQDDANTLTVRRRIQTAIVTTLTTWEPRIALDRVDVDTVPDAPDQVHVQIYYRLLRTGEPQQLGATLQAG